MPVGVEGAAADRQRSPLDSEAGLSRGGLGNAHRSRHDLVADVVALKHTQAQASGRHHNSFRCGATVQPAALRSVASGTDAARSEEHTSELQSLMRISYAVFCLKKKKMKKNTST